MARVCDHIDQTQEALGRQMLLENPSSYLRFEESTLAEPDFIRAVARRTGCGLLLDVNNVFVSAHNLGTSPEDYVEAFPLDLVQEIHLAGHDLGNDAAGEPVLIDAHGSPVAGDVWALYRRVIAASGPKPSLIERDNNVPPLADLVAEAQMALRIMADAARRAA